MEQRLIWLLLAAIALRLLVWAGSTELYQDEAYYWDGTRHLDLSYSDHPPLLVYLAYATTALFGQSELAVRLSSILGSLLLMALLYLLGARLFTPRTGLLAVVLMQLIPASLAFHQLLPDIPALVCWTLAIYCVWLAVHRRPAYWYAAGAAAGLGILAKYYVVLLIPSVLLYLALSPLHRPWLRRREPYVAGVISGLFTLPVLIWNAQRGWVTLGDTAQLGHISQAPYTLYTLLENMVEPMGWFFPTIYLAVLAGVVHSGRLGLERQSDSHLLAACAAAPTLLFFGLIGLRLNLNGNWIAPAMITGTLAAAHWLEQLPGTRGRIARWAAYGAPAALFVLLQLTVFTPVAPTWRATVLNLSLGWRELARAVDQQLARLPPGTMIISSGYWETAPLAFYTQGRTLVSTPEFIAWSFQYNYWPERQLHIGDDALYVCSFLPCQDAANTLARYFNTVENVGDISISHAGIELRRAILYRCRGFRGQPTWGPLPQEPSRYSEHNGL